VLINHGPCAVLGVLMCCLLVCCLLMYRVLLAGRVQAQLPGPPEAGARNNPQGACVPAMSCSTCACAVLIILACTPVLVLRTAALFDTAILWFLSEMMQQQGSWSISCCWYKPHQTMMNQAVGFS
jgi:hypothetical protein